ncbi:BTAD domain-containing putative transcriptional regulator [Candidatus Formimonas warabiya]|uniref:BTAD domain-containing putative transcriptional regulator n=1 Tax=Formimonas warabiya TaxID=1761012 RepID=UPI001BE443E2|nr:BTAD domain-containing putative transcriptional regulator [Candidatus Formimonas warabiya]
MAIYTGLKEDFIQSLDQSNQEKALKCFFALKKINPYDEDIVRLMMRFYHKRNEIEKCISLYKDLERVLHDDLSVEPNLELKNYCRNILLEKKYRPPKSAKYFYGRKNELGKIQNFYLNFSNGLRHSSIILFAPIGCGKTALLNHYLNTTINKENILIHFTCFEVEKNTQLRILELIMYKLVSATGTNINSLPENCRYLLSHVLPQIFNNFVYDFHFSEADTSQFFSQYKIEETLSEFFQFMLQKYKLFLVIDDLQFCDLSSLSFIARILCPVFKERLLCLFAAREENHKDIIRYFKNLIMENDMEVIHIGNFSKEDVSNILQDILDIKDHSPSDSLYDSTNGNPLFLMEVIQNMRSNNTSQNYKFLTLLEEKVEKLDALEKTVLSISSLFFDFINYDIISGIINLDVIKTLEVFESLVNQGFIKEEISANKIKLKFSHEKFREYIYQKQPLVKRMSLHGKIADYIADHMLGDTFNSYLTDSMIYHYKLAGHNVKYLEYKLKVSGQIVCSGNDLPELLTPITQSYIEELEREINENTVTPQMKFEFYLLKGCFLIRTCRYREGLDNLNYVIKYDSDYYHLWIAYRHLVLYSVQILDKQNMREHTLSSLRLLRKWPDELKKAEILKFFALSEMHNLHFENAQKVLQRSLDIFQHAKSNSNTVNNIACIYNYMGYEARHKGEYEKTIPYYEKAIEICSNGGIIYGLPLYYMNLGQAFYKLGDIDKAKKYFTISNSLHYKIDNPLSKSLTNAYLALICFQAEEYRQSEEYLSQAIEISKVLDNLYENAYLYKIICLIKHQIERNKSAQVLFDSIIPENYNYYLILAQSTFKQLHLEREMEDIFRS